MILIKVEQKTESRIEKSQDQIQGELSDIRKDFKEIKNSLIKFKSRGNGVLK